MVGRTRPQTTGCQTFHGAVPEPEPRLGPEQLNAGCGLKTANRARAAWLAATPAPDSGCGLMPALEHPASQAARALCIKSPTDLRGAIAGSAYFYAFSRASAVRQCEASFSMRIKRHWQSLAATPVVPDPAKGSRTMSSGLENVWMSGRIAMTGFSVG